jgi:hypothetical protein
MKKVLLMAGALVALTAGIASAQGGLNLAWNDCGAAGQSNRNIACTTNSGLNTLVASIVTGFDIPNLVSEESVMDLQTNQAALSPWWLIGGTNCRAATAVAASFDFTGGPFTCVDLWENAGFGGVNYLGPFEQPNRARIRTVYAINPGKAIDGVSEWYLFKVNINNSRSTGTGACAGCLDAACIVLNSVKMIQPIGEGDYTIVNPLLSQSATWQGGVVGGGCPGATPTKSATWGSVKSLYR